MPSTTTLPRIFDLPPDERRDAHDDAMARATEAQREAAREHKARKPDPRSIHDYRGYNTMRMVCVLVARHAPKPASFDCSRDGSRYPRIYLPFSKCIEQPESTDDFLLVCVPKWLAEKVELMGVTPLLVGDFTDSQRETWNRLRDLRVGINSKIYFAKKRPASVLSRSAVA
jgi:hypothetical protein